MAKLLDDDFIPIRKFIFLILKNWQWFILSISLSLLVALLVNRYSTNVYTNSIRMNVNNSTSVIDPLESVLGEKTSRFNSVNFSDKIFMITSYPLVFKTVNDLGFDIEYFIQGNIKTAENYKFRPISFENIDFINKNINEFKINLINKSQYTIESDILPKNTYQFDEVVKTPLGSFSISLNENSKIDKIDEYPDLIIKVNNPHVITKNYKRNIKVNRLSKEASIINISVQGEDLIKETEFLNKLCENYIQDDLNTKNKVSTNTISFIDKQIAQTKDSLNLIEAKLQIFKIVS